MMENLLIFVAKLGVIISSIMIFLILLEYKRQYDSGYWSGKKRTPGSGKKRTPGSGTGRNNK